MQSSTFVVKDCALAAIATGQRAHSLVEFRERIETIDPDCIYYHFWSGHLRPQFTHPDYPNDFAAWAHYTVHDLALAERLGAIDPTEFTSIEDLRQNIIDIVDESLEEKDFIIWSRKDQQFQFIKSKVIVFETSHRLKQPIDLLKTLPHMTLTSIFYHFIDAKRRNEREMDDFTRWLEGYDEEFKELVQQIRLIDPYFLSLRELKDNLVKACETFFMKKNESLNFSL